REDPTLSRYGTDLLQALILILRRRRIHSSAWPSPSPSHFRNLSRLAQSLGRIDRNLSIYNNAAPALTSGHSLYPRLHAETDMINENAQNDFAGQGDTSVAEPTTGLRRSVGFYGLMFVSLGSIIGSGWLLGALNAAKVAGPASIISWVLAAGML